MALEGLDELTRDQLAQLALSMSGNAKTRKQFLKLTKEVAPGTPIPEIDNESELDSKLAAERERYDKLEQRMNDNELKAKLGSAKKAAMETYGLDDEQMKSMEEMIGKGELPADYKWASQLYKQQLDQAAPTAYGSSGWGPAELPANEGLMENPDKWAKSTAHQMIDDMHKKGHSFSNS
jgi:hypothetical protein